MTRRSYNERNRRQDSAAAARQRRILEQEKALRPTRPAYYVKEVQSTWDPSITEYVVMDWTDRAITTKLTRAAADAAVDRLYEHLRNYGDAYEAGLDISDV